MLVGRHHQARQPHQVFFTRLRVVHAGVAGVGMQVLQRFPHGGVMSIDDRLGQHLIPTQSTQQRHTFRRRKRQIETVRGARTIGAATDPVGRDSVIEPTRHHVHVGFTASAIRSAQTDERGGLFGVARTHPYRRAGLTLGVVLSQPAAGSLAPGRRHRRARSVVVVAHRMPLHRRRNRQHPRPPVQRDRRPRARGGVADRRFATPMLASPCANVP